MAASLTRSADDLMVQYARYHRDRRNIATHAAGLPMIALAGIILLSRFGIDVRLGDTTLVVTAAMVVATATSIYYLLLDRALGAALTVINIVMLFVGNRVAGLAAPVWIASACGLLVTGTVLQFIGHYFEGNRPAFVDDLISTLIGPLFVMAELFFLLGLRRDLQRDVEARAGPRRAPQRPGA